MRMPKIILLVLLLSTLLSSIYGQYSYMEEIEEWHEARINRLRQPIGWLSLVGLIWIEEGKSTSFGGSADHRIQFPPEAPSEIGWVLLTGDSVRLMFQDQVTVQYNDAVVHEVNISRSEIEQSGMLTCGRFRWMLLERGGKIGFRIWDTEKPILQTFESIPHYPIDSSWRLTASFVPADSSEELEMDNVLGMKIKIQPTGYIHFEKENQRFQLQTLPGTDSTYFVIFSDETSGIDTYGGGRYVYIPKEDLNGQTEIDFNKSYNPPCLFTDFATCLLPSRDNHLHIKIEAGELAGDH